MRGLASGIVCQSRIWNKLLGRRGALACKASKCMKDLFGKAKGDGHGFRRTTPSSEK